MSILKWMLLTTALLSLCSSYADQPISTKPKTQIVCRCLPSQACWPKQDVWQTFSHQLSSPLVRPVSPVAACKKDTNSQACVQALKQLHNPFYLQSRPGNTESYGWWKAWKYQNSDYAVEARNTKDIVAAVNFARQHNIKLVIKGAGHDYLGRSNAPNSLLIWTHHLQTLTYHTQFIPTGAPQETKAVSAITVGAGVNWFQVYQKAAQHHQYIQGGGCMSVGAAGGFTLGGGFGSWSKQYGTGAANLLQATLVTADGKVLTVNAYRHPDLFWALRGAGFGMGVVVQMTYRTFPLPHYFGFVNGKITAKDNASYKLLIEHFLVFLRDHIINPSWGEQVAFSSNNEISLALVSQGLDEKSEAAVWAPFVKWVDSQPQRFTIKIKISEKSPQQIWRYNSRNLSMTLNKLPGAPKDQFWWTGDGEQTYAYWVSYQSWWLPINLFENKNVNRLANTIFNATKQLPPFISLSLHLNKGLAGAAPDAIQRTHNTSINPSVLDAAGLVIIASALPPEMMFDKPQYLPKKTQEMLAQLHLTTQDLSPERVLPAIHKAVDTIRNLAPHAGAYVNEASYFQPDWQHAFWGGNYSKLLSIKQKYDPTHLFYCHHCVGSEGWDKSGLCQIKK